jgi:hypothetical protein
VAGANGGTSAVYRTRCSGQDLEYEAARVWDDVFYREAGVLRCRNHIAIEMTPAGQSTPRRSEPVLQPSDEPIRSPYVFQQPYGASRADRTTYLHERVHRCRDRAQRETDHRVVERAIPERKRLRIGGYEEYGGAGRGGARASPRQHAGVHVSRNDRDTRLVVSEVEPCPGTDLEHAASRGSHDRPAPSPERAGFGRAHYRVVDPREEVESHKPRLCEHSVQTPPMIGRLGRP